MTAAVVVLHNARSWTCPHCAEEHALDHDLDDLCNLECRRCGRVTLGRLISGSAHA